MDNIVMVPVPANRLQEVYELLAKPSGGTAAGGRKPWPPETLTRCYRESSSPMQAFLDALADNGGRLMSGGDLGRAIGYTERNQMAGMLGAAGKRIVNRYNLQFPFEAEWRASEGVYYYTMNEEDAAVIKSLRTPE
jgi:hypothetical protein